MDCKAQIALAKMIGRDNAATTLQSRFDTVNKAVLANLWNSSAGCFQNRLSKDLSPVARMAPTNFYPMLAGPEAGPSADQVKATITRHLVSTLLCGRLRTHQPTIRSRLLKQTTCTVEKQDLRPQLWAHSQHCS